MSSALTPSQIDELLRAFLQHRRSPHHYLGELKQWGKGGYYFLKQALEAYERQP